MAPRRKQNALLSRAIGGAVLFFYDDMQGLFRLREAGLPCSTLAVAEVADDMSEVGIKL